MWTTIDLPDELAEAVQAKAAAEGRTFTSVVEDGLRAVLADDRPVTTRPLPAFGKPDGGLLVDLHDRDAGWDALDAGDPA